MPWPFTFGTATSPLAASHWDDMFNQVGAGMSIPCTAAGSNAVSLTPQTNFPALPAYNQLGGYRFVAAASSTGAVTAQYNGLGFLPVYHADGTTQANINDILIGQQYIFTFVQALNGGLGGFFFESPSQPLAASNWFTPGGRLTLQSAVPVMTGTVSSQNIFYAPFRHAFVPIYNGSNVQMYQFTSSLSDQVGLTLAMGGNAAWPTANAFDVFATVIGGVPVLATIQWTSLTTRATTLSVFGGFLTNSGSATSLRSGPTTFTLPANQGTFLGSFFTTINGQTIFQFAGAASGGNPCNFALCNYYNKVLFTTINTDNGATYTYSSATVRQARASANNSMLYMQSDSEAPATFVYNTENLCAAVAGAFGNIGLGLNTTTFLSNAFSVFQAPAARANAFSNTVSLSVGSTGQSQIFANEQGDGANANTFDQSTSNAIQANIWL